MEQIMFLESPPVARRSIYQRKKGKGKLESVVSLEEHSLAAMMCFKMEGSLRFLQSY
jgi:hypothetical protein